MPSALHAGLSGLVDYAGLFPPASLALPDVAARFARYAGSRERWMLGRLVVPLTQLEALSAAIDVMPASAHPWSASVLLHVETPLGGVEDVLTRFEDRHRARRVTVASVELAPSSPARVAEVATALPTRVERYVEVPLGPEMARWLDAIAGAGCHAKVRTGGLSEDRIPPALALAGFLRDAAARGLAFKATAGLHHPVRGCYRLTYEPASPSGRMHGFVNLVAAASLAVRDRDIDAPTLAALLDEGDPRAFSISEHSIAWSGVALAVGDLSAGRERGLRSVGSCSFEEPVADLRALGWLPGAGLQPVAGSR